VATFVSSVGPIGSAGDIEALEGKALLAVFNELSSKQTKKFASRAKGVEQTKRAFTQWADQQKAAGVVVSRKEPLPENIRTFRRSGIRAKILELASKAGGATVAQLMEATNRPAKAIRQQLYRLRGDGQLSVTIEEDKGDEATVVVAGTILTRKPFCFSPKRDCKDHKPNTKRAKVLEMLQQGATFEQVKEATGWNTKDAMEGIRLLHDFLGYGLKETADGIIKAYR